MMGQKKRTKSQYSLLNALTSAILTLVNGLLGIVTTRYVIAVFGSDFNGLNSTANQIVNVLLILEGGFTVASTVSLFRPLGENDITAINGILSATSRKFRRIGVLFLAVGTVATVGYTFVVNSQLPSEIIFTVLWMTVFPAAFNLFFATTYRVVLQAQQKEYIINGITAVTIGTGHIVNIFLVTHGGQMWMVRFVTMFFSLVNSTLIAFYVRKNNKYLNFNNEERHDLIKGTNDVLIQKITGVVYDAAPIIFLSISAAGGTTLASVYAVYNNVCMMIKSLLHSLIDAPRLGFGQMISERNRSEVWPVFAQYELLAFMGTAVLLITTYALILPFVFLYVGGIADANYNDPILALLLTLVVSVEMIHIPSGHLLNMAGEFHVSRNIQIIACISLFVFMPMGGFLWGIYGMIGAILIVACLLAIMEMGYVHIHFFPKTYLSLVKLMLPTAFISVVLAIIESSFSHQINSVVSFVVTACSYLVINLLCILVVNAVLHRKLMFSLFDKVLFLFR